MNTSLSVALETVLTKHQEEVSAREEQTGIRNMKREEFLHRFDKIAELTILPAAKTFAGELANKGHELKVSFASSVHPEPDTVTICGGVFTNFLPNTQGSVSQRTPSMRFVPSVNTEYLQIFGTCLEPQSAGRTFDLGCYPLEKIDRDFVHKMLLRLIDGGLAFTNFRARS